MRRSSTASRRYRLNRQRRFFDGLAPLKIDHVPLLAGVLGPGQAAVPDEVDLDAVDAVGQILRWQSAAESLTRIPQPHPIDEHRVDGAIWSAVDFALR